MPIGEPKRANFVPFLRVQIEIGEQGKALRRRFWEVRATELHRQLGIRLRNNYEIAQLKREGNTQPGAVFESWNYLENMPSIKPLPTPAECQKIIRDCYYGRSV